MCEIVGGGKRNNDMVRGSIVGGAHKNDDVMRQCDRGQ